MLFRKPNTNRKNPASSRLATANCREQAYGWATSCEMRLLLAELYLLPASESKTKIVFPNDSEYCSLDPMFRPILLGFAFSVSAFAHPPFKIAARSGTFENSNPSWNNPFWSICQPFPMLPLYGAYRRAVPETATRTKSVPPAPAPYSTRGETNADRPRQAPRRYPGTRQ